MLTRDAGFAADGAECAASLPDAIARLGGEPLAFVIGGAQVYALALPLAQQLWLTEIERDFDGDCRFPDWPRDQFDEVARDRHQAAPPNDFTYSFVTYRRRAPRG